MNCTNTTARIQNEISNGAQLTILAPTNDAFSSYLVMNNFRGDWQAAIAAMCDTADGNNNRTAEVLAAHVLSRVISSSAITANNGTPADLYSYAYFPNYQIIMLNLGGVFTVKQQVPFTTQTFVPRKYDNAISGNAAVAHMITAVLLVPLPFPPPPPPPPPPGNTPQSNAAAVSVYAGLLNELEAARLVSLVDKYDNITLPTLPSGGQSSQSVSAVAYLKTPDTVATVLVPTINAVGDFLSRVTLGGRAMTFADCEAPTLPGHADVCRALMQFAIVPRTEFLPSFDPTTYNLTSGFGVPDTARYAYLNHSTAYPGTPGTAETQIVYKLDTTPPVDASTLAFQTTANPPCVGIARSLKGPIPAGVPSFLTRLQGMIYLIDQVLFPVEAYNNAIIANGGAYRPANGC
ncbi:hypothetical protein HXX76_016052 [Chlamydomonas incerta]|uniref:FAS1 domain-containing protein n=1 Tax=Chlamydomonas incerta TaxID=51695 RepID=A0A835S7Y1_CHLIN|nr:hypothetical protein HXX76_016052 [Chlamydomonas incerta]|eukprot:KAG2422407.1 hypothetical protein HXX76_016052 [Chlamydomonas incerta]